LSENARASEMAINTSNNKKHLLVVIAGPTAVGKTDVAVVLAQSFGTGIISADSRQFYKEMQIGNAIPSAEQLALVSHHFIGHISIHDPYDVSRFESDALQKLNELFAKQKIVIMAGGSGLYINAVCRGFDELPDKDPMLREKLLATLEKGGLQALQEQLRQLDPEYFAKVDRSNPNRLMRAIEVCMIAGKPYSQLRKGEVNERPFSVLKIALNRSREELFARIGARTDQMISAGLLEEVKSLAPYRHLNALNTVGYKELFDFLDGKCTFQQALTDIKTNTRRYAKRQLTWFKKDPEYHWFHPNFVEEMASLVLSQTT